MDKSHQAAKTASALGKTPDAAELVTAVARVLFLLQYDPSAVLSTFSHYSTIPAVRIALALDGVMDAVRNVYRNDQAAALHIMKHHSPEDTFKWNTTR